MDGAGELVALAGAVGNDRPGRCSSKGELSRSSHRAHSPCGTRDSQLSLLRNHLHKLLAEHRPREDGLQEPLGLILPPDAKEVDRQPAEDNGKANATLLEIGRAHV